MRDVKKAVKIRIHRIFYWYLKSVMPRESNWFIDCNTKNLETCKKNCETTYNTNARQRMSGRYTGEEWSSSTRRKGYRNGIRPNFPPLVPHTRGGALDFFSQFLACFRPAKVTPGDNSVTYTQVVPFELPQPTAQQAPTIAVQPAVQQATHVAAQQATALPSPQQELAKDIAVDQFKNLIKDLPLHMSLLILQSYIESLEDVFQSAIGFAIAPSFKRLYSHVYLDGNMVFSKERYKLLVIRNIKDHILAITKAYIPEDVNAVLRQLPVPNIPSININDINILNPTVSDIETIAKIIALLIKSFNGHTDKKPVNFIFGCSEDGGNDEPYIVLHEYYLQFCLTQNNTTTTLSLEFENYSDFYLKDVEYDIDDENNLVYLFEGIKVEENIKTEDSLTDLKTSINNLEKNITGLITRFYTEIHARMSALTTNNIYNDGLVTILYAQYYRDAMMKFLFGPAPPVVNTFIKASTIAPNPSQNSANLTKLQKKLISSFRITFDNKTLSTDAQNIISKVFGQVRMGTLADGGGKKPQYTKTKLTYKDKTGKQCIVYSCNKKKYIRKKSTTGKYNYIEIKR